MANTARTFLIMLNKIASKRPIQKPAKTTGDLIGNKMADKTTEVSKTSQQNNLETAKNEHVKEKPKERYISPEERPKIIEYQRLI